MDKTLLEISCTLWRRRKIPFYPSWFFWLAGYRHIDKSKSNLLSYIWKSHIRESQRPSTAQEVQR